MKVRHKTIIGLIFELLEESPNYYIGRFAPGFSAVGLPKTDYELVPEVRWVDVTGECEARPCDQANGGLLIWHGDVIVTCNPNYRAIKKRIFLPGGATVCFIFERKEDGGQPH